MIAKHCNRDVDVCWGWASCVESGRPIPQAQPTRLHDWWAFKALDPAAKWETVFYLIAQSSRRVGRFRPGTVLVEAWPKGGASAQFWDPSVRRKRKAVGADGPAPFDPLEDEGPGDVHDEEDLGDQGEGEGGQGNSAWSDAECCEDGEVPLGL